MEDEWVLLSVFPNEMLAQMVRSMLEAEGIPALLNSTLARTVYGGLTPVQILVTAQHLSQAREVLERVETET